MLALLKAGADINAQNGLGQTALWLTINYCQQKAVQEAVVAFLIAHEADPLIEDDAVGAVV